jgi:hypothetical protein
MSTHESPDLSGITQHLGVSEETTRRWQDAGLINPKPLTGGIRRVTREEIAERASEGTLYEPTISRHAAEAAIKSALEEPEPPTAA